MYLVALVWLYVALMMAVAEATHTQGTVLGAVLTFLLYGAGPVALVTYLLGTPARRARRLALAARPAEVRADAAAPATQAIVAQEAPSVALDPHQRRHAAGDTVASERIEP